MIFLSVVLVVLFLAAYLVGIFKLGLWVGVELIQYHWDLSEWLGSLAYFSIIFTGLFGIPLGVIFQLTYGGN